MKAIHIKVKQKPDYTPELGVDENELIETLDKEITYGNIDAKNKDIDSLTAIFRLRKGEVKKELESCNAIFVTPNSKLAKASCNGPQKVDKGDSWM